MEYLHVTMKKFWTFIALSIYTLGASYVFTIYSFYYRNLNETKPTEIKEKIYPTYYDEDKFHAEWPFSTSKNYYKLNLSQWTEPKQSTNKNVNAYGEASAVLVTVPPDLQILMNKSVEKYNYNLFASNMISLHRSLPDPRSEQCKALSYPEKLPTTSVIIIFHNEGWTPLLRTVWSVINRSPLELIKEIILVDDVSTWTFLKRPLEDYIKQLPVHIKLIRTSKREGLIRARIIGAKHATANVLTFFDGHIECNEGWLQPILSSQYVMFCTPLYSFWAHGNSKQTTVPPSSCLLYVFSQDSGIKNDRSVIAVPFIDTISSDSMKYLYSDDIHINGFSWSLFLTWMSVPERELIRNHYDYTAPLRTPTIIGCALSVDREFFFEIGSFDEGMNIWGSENLELALRVWQCGGSVEVIPCSRVGHLYRISTYSFNGNKYQIVAQNNVRLVEVWMSDLKHLYYSANPEMKNLPAGDLTNRKELKQRLKCKDFRWYLENIYPENTMFNEFIEIGQIRSVSENACVENTENDQFIMYPCHLLSGNQVFGFAKNQLIVTTEQLCLGANFQEHSVLSKDCMEWDKLQLWKYDTEKRWIIHIGSKLCLQANKTKVILGNCKITDYSFKWDINSTL